MRVRMLNHASVLLEIGPVRLLADPWFFGTCFDGGWGLRYDAPAALDLAATATHLWISHFHADHFHVDTLRALCERNPDIVALGNRSKNFQLDEALAGLGFKNVVPLAERAPSSIAPGITVERYPVTGIDNMLLVRAGGTTVLNYNDCVLPARARRALAKKIGPVDVFLTNFNHAGKLLTYPLPDVETVQRGLLSNFSHGFPAFDPTVVIPFASHHYYRAPENAPQNASLLTVDDLTAVDDRVLPLRVGQTATLDPGTWTALVETHDPGVTEVERERLDRGPTRTLAELEAAATGYAARIRRAFPLVGRAIPVLTIRVDDLAETIRLDPRRGLVGGEGEPDISAHSSALHRWWTHPYGSDSFVVGGHFALCRTDTTAFRRNTIAALLSENRLDARSMARMAVTPSGARFLWNRREEILGILISGQVGAEYQQPGAL